MKKIITLCFVLCLASISFGQFIKRGSIIGNGSIQFESSKDKDFSDQKQTRIVLSPWGGFMVIDNLSAGVGFTFESSLDKNTSGKFTDSGFLFGPVVRYYLDQGIFFHGQFQFGSLKQVNEPTGSSKTTTKEGISEFRIGAGYAVRISDTVLLEPIIGYKNYTNNDSSFSSGDSGIFFMLSFTVIVKSVE